MIFRNYGADVYYLNGTAVKGGEEPFQEECGDLLLGAIGQSRENYLVEGVAWDGESYVDESGVPCRRALAVGKKRVWSERTVYWGRRLAQEEPETEAQVIVLGSPMEDIFPACGGGGGGRGKAGSAGPGRGGCPVPGDPAPARCRGGVLGEREKEREGGAAGERGVAVCGGGQAAGRGEPRRQLRPQEVRQAPVCPRGRCDNCPGR